MGGRKMLKDWIGDSDICIVYPQECSWYVLASAVASHLGDNVSIVSKDTEASCFNTGFGIGNKDQVPKSLLDITSYTISPSELSSVSSKYLIYDDISSLPSNLATVKDKCLIVLVTRGVTQEDMSRVPGLTVLKYVDQSYDSKIDFNLLTVVTHDQHAKVITHYKDTPASLMLTNFHYPIEVCARILTGWTFKKEVSDNRQVLYDNYSSLMGQGTSHVSPKINELIVSINNAKDQRHVVVSGFSANYGCHMISKMLELHGISNLVLSYQNSCDADDVMEQFHRQTNTVLITNFAPVDDVRGITNIHILDTYNIKVFQGWLKYSYKKDLMGSNTLRVKLYVLSYQGSPEMSTSTNFWTSVKKLSAGLNKIKESAIPLYADMTVDAGSGSPSYSPKNSPPVTANAALNFITGNLSLH